MCVFPDTGPAAGKGSHTGLPLPNNLWHIQDLRSILIKKIKNQSLYLAKPKNANCKIKEVIAACRDSAIFIFDI